MREQRRGWWVIRRDALGRFVRRPVRVVHMSGECGEPSCGLHAGPPIRGMSDEAVRYFWVVVPAMVVAVGVFVVVHL